MRIKTNNNKGWRKKLKIIMIKNKDDKEFKW